MQIDNLDQSGQFTSPNVTQILCILYTVEIWLFVLYNLFIVPILPGLRTSNKIPLAPMGVLPKIVDT